RLDILPSGVQWYCFTITADDGHVSMCLRYQKACNQLRTTAQRGGHSTPQCQPQAKAAAFTYYDVMNDQQSWEAAASVTDCKNQRKFLLTDDYKNVSNCAVVGTIPERPIDRTQIPPGQELVLPDHDRNPGQQSQRGLLSHTGCLRASPHAT